MKKIMVGIFLFSIFFLGVSADIAPMQCIDWDDDCLKKSSTDLDGTEIFFGHPCCNRYRVGEKGTSRINHTPSSFTQAQYVSMVGGCLFLVFLGVLFYRRKKLTAKKGTNDN